MQATTVPGFMAPVVPSPLPVGDYKAISGILAGDLNTANGRLWASREWTVCYINERARAPLSERCRKLLEAQR